MLSAGRPPAPLAGAPATAWLTLAARAHAARTAATAEGDPALQDYCDVRAHEAVIALPPDVPLQAPDTAFVRGVVLRTQWFDRIVQRFLAAHPRAMAITLGAGFCTRWSRLWPALPRPHAVDWFNIDLPEVLAWRERCLPRGEAEHDLAFSALDPAWMDAMPWQPGRPAIVLMEGVCPYLPQAPLEALLRRLAGRLEAEQVPGRLLLDFTHPALARRPQRVGDTPLPVVSGFEDADQVLELHPTLRLLEEDHPFARFSRGHHEFAEVFVAACDRPPYTLACLGLGPDCE
jgi:O-methyltransferase involved in polyketide biosynthesis